VAALGVGQQTNAIARTGRFEAAILAESGAVCASG
jgi:hypothetical protein